MDNQIQIFKHEQFGEIRTVMVDNEPWFVGRDVAVALGYSKPENAISNHVCKEDKTLTLIQGGCSTGSQKTMIINESGIYALIFSSKLPKAQEFKHWVTSEVLPTIRKHGVYMTPEALEQAVCTPDFLLRVVTQLKTEHDERVRLAAENAEMKPKAEYLEKILQSDEALTVTQIAKDYNMGPAAFNQKLHEFGVQYNVGGQWVLYQKYCGNGYTQSYTATYRDKQGDTQTKTYTKWTQVGRKFLYEVLHKHDILPVMERTV